MTKQEFDKFINSLDKDNLTEEIILEVCAKHKELNLADRNWEDLNKSLGMFKSTGENLRCWYKHKLANDGLLPENPMVLKNDKTPQDLNSSEVEDKFDQKIQELRKERVKAQSILVHKYRLDRQDARKELFTELLEDSIKSLPLPDIKIRPVKSSPKEYMLCLGDIHYGANFQIDGNSYSIEECENRFEKLLSEVVSFVKEKDIDKLKVINLGDSVQGLIHINDFKINQIPVADAITGVSELIADFLNKLSGYCDVEYNHICFANHTQIRPLGTKANEVSCEDLEKVIFKMIKLSLKNNPAVIVKGDVTKDYLKVNVFDFKCCACHGHTIKNIREGLKDLSNHHREWYSYLILGHTHSQKEYSCGCEGSHNLKTLVAPSFIGLDPYADSLLVSSKAGAVIFGFDEKYGQTEKYDIILN